MRIYKNTKVLIVLSIILLAAFAGCTGKNEQTVNQSVPPDDGIKTSGESGKASGWCSTGTKMDIPNPTGQKATFEIKGITNYEGKDVCWAEYKYSEGSMAEYFNQDQSYAVLIVKDKNGKDLQKMDLAQPK